MYSNNNEHIIVPVSIIEWRSCLVQLVCFLTRSRRNPMIAALPFGMLSDDVMAVLTMRQSIVKFQVHSKTCFILLLSILFPFDCYISDCSHSSCSLLPLGSVTILFVVGLAPSVVMIGRVVVSIGIGGWCVFNLVVPGLNVLLLAPTVVPLGGVVVITSCGVVVGSFIVVVGTCVVAIIQTRLTC